MKISVSGNIGSGKSTVLELINAAGFDTAPEPVDSWKFLEKFNKDKQKYAYPLSVEILNSFAQLKHVKGDLVVERSPYETVKIFGSVLHKSGFLTKAELLSLEDFADAFCWEPELIVFLDTPAYICHERIEKRGRNTEDLLTYDYIKSLEFEYIKAFENGIFKRSSVIRVQVDENDTPDVVASRVIEIIREKFKKNE